MAGTLGFLSVSARHTERWGPGVRHQKGPNSVEEEILAALLVDSTVTACTKSPHSVTRRQLPASTRVRARGMAKKMLGVRKWEKR